MRQLRIHRREGLSGHGWVAAQREHVGDAFTLHPVEDLTRAVGAVRACEMRHRLDVVVPLDACHKLERLVSGAHAIGHGHPVGRVPRERRHRLLEHVDLALVARRHELE